MLQSRTDAAYRRVIDRWRTAPATAPAAAAKAASGSANRFVEVVATGQGLQPPAPSPSASALIEISLPGGAVVRVGAGVEEVSLRRVLRALS